MTQAFYRQMQWNCSQYFDKVTARCLVIVGEADMLTPPASCAQVVDLLPSARLAVVAKASHQVMQERPHEVCSSCVCAPVMHGSVRVRDRVDWCRLVCPLPQ